MSLESEAKNLDRCFATRSLPLNEVKGFADASFRSSASLRTPLSMTNSTLDCNLVLGMTKLALTDNDLIFLIAFFFDKTAISFFLSTVSGYRDFCWNIPTRCCKLPIGVNFYNAQLLPSLFLYHHSKIE